MSKNCFHNSYGYMDFSRVIIPIVHALKFPPGIKNCMFGYSSYPLPRVTCEGYGSRSVS